MTAPRDEELLEVLADAFAGRQAVRLRRRPYSYATSARLEEIDVTLSDGDERTLIFKDLAWEHRLDDARGTKPAFLDEPRRDIDTYTRILGREGIGPHCYAAVVDPPRGRRWLLLEKVPGVELWQIGDLRVWEDVARWLGRFHTRFAGTAVELRAANPHLLQYGSEWYARWRQRAADALVRSADPRAPELRGALDVYDDVIDALAALPATFVHGEFYPSNVLVGDDRPELEVWPVDWEMAGTGPGVLDLAALVSGWEPANRARLVSAYRSAAPPGSERALDYARLHLALQWIGWSSDWAAPREHASDWVGDALGLLRELGT